MFRHIIFVFLASVITINSANANEPVKNSILLTLAKIDWVLYVNGTDWVLSRKEITPDGNDAHFYAENTKTGMIMSGFLEEHPRSGTAKQCRRYYWSKARKSPLNKENILLSDFGDMAIVEYMINEHEGIKVKQKNVNAYLAKDKFWMDIHLSKTGYKESDKELFDSVLNSIKITDKKQNCKTRINYKIADQGILTLDVPGNWIDETWQGSEDSPVEIILNPPLENSSKVLITVMWQKKESGNFNEPQKVSNVAEKFGNEALAQAVEDRLDIKEIKSSSGIGYYYTLTDNAPKPDEYKYMTQGIYGLKKYLMSFTILSNEKDSDATKAALETIATAKE